MIKKKLCSMVANRSRCSINTALFETSWTAENMILRGGSPWQYPPRLHPCRSNPFTYAPMMVTHPCTFHVWKRCLFTASKTCHPITKSGMVWTWRPAKTMSQRARERGTGRGRERGRGRGKGRGKERGGAGGGGEVARTLRLVLNGIIHRWGCDPGLFGDKHFRARRERDDEADFATIVAALLRRFTRCPGQGALNKYPSAKLRWLSSSNKCIYDPTPLGPRPLQRHQWLLQLCCDRLGTQMIPSWSELAVLMVQHREIMNGQSILIAYNCSICLMYSLIEY